MSAIFGILRYDDQPIAASDLERMGNTLRHRGPDGRKQLIDGRLGLGHCLMRVNREDLFEAQPLRNRSRSVTLVADCRIDNREALASRLDIGADRLAHLPDSALVLRAYETWGEDCAAQLIGDFAFAIWDTDAGRLVLGRDHMGQRNLFYHRGETSSPSPPRSRRSGRSPTFPVRLSEQEIARLLQPDQPAQDPRANSVHGHLRDARGDDRHRDAGSGDLTPALLVAATNPAHEGRDEAYYIAQYRSVLAEAVACRLRRLTAPAALLMSAGFDTAAIAGLAGPVVAAQRRKLIGLSWLGLGQGSRPGAATFGPGWRLAAESCPTWKCASCRASRRARSRPSSASFTPTTAPAAAPQDRRPAHAVRRCGRRRRIQPGHGWIRRRLHAQSAGNQALWPATCGEFQFGRFLAEFAARTRCGRPRDRPGGYVQADSRPDAAPARRDRAGNAAVRRIRIAQRLVHLGHARGRGPAPAGAQRARRRRSATSARLHSLHRDARVQPPGRGQDQSRGPAGAGAIAAAAHGLDLTRPFHDKRVVELGLAIPEDLYVKHGLNRYLARRALADVYPPEFQSRGRRNEGVLGDILVLDPATPTLLAEADRRAASPRKARRHVRLRTGSADPGGVRPRSARGAETGRRPSAADGPVHRVVQRLERSIDHAGQAGPIRVGWRAVSASEGP